MSENGEVASPLREFCAWALERGLSKCERRQIDGGVRVRCQQAVQMMRPMMDFGWAWFQKIERAQCNDVPWFSFNEDQQGRGNILSEEDSFALYWPCDEHGNKVRWPTDAQGNML